MVAFYVQYLAPILYIFFASPDINMAFHQAARNVLIDDESLLQRFHLGVQFKGNDKSNFFVSFLHAFSQRISHEGPIFIGLIDELMIINVDFFFIMTFLFSLLNLFPYIYSDSDFLVLF